MLTYKQWVAKLKALRLRREWRQQDVAERVSFSRSQYCAIETGKCVANYVHLRKLAKAFRVSIEKLVSMKGI